MSWIERRGIGFRIALAALGIAFLSLAIVTVGVMVVGGNAFMELMTAHGETADEARRMFESTVLGVLAVAVAVAALLAIVLAALAGRWLARPLREMSGAARRISRGDYRIRIERTRGADEVASLTDSFNQMSASLLDQERIRREFIANAAHELRTPLTNLKGYLEGLRDGVIEADRATFESLWEETERLVRLSESLDRLDELPGTRPALVEVDVARAIETAVALNRPAAASRDLAWSIEVPAAVPALADPDHLAQVISNLLQNAVRYTPNGGRVEVRAVLRTDDVLVSVRNSGSTIPPADLPRVFERFYRIDRSRDRRSGGAGIGLAIVKQLVEAAGGRVGADSGEGRTTFWFSLPRP